MGDRGNLRGLTLIGCKEKKLSSYSMSRLKVGLPYHINQVIHLSLPLYHQIPPDRMQYEVDNISYVELLQKTKKQQHIVFEFRNKETRQI